MNIAIRTDSSVTIGSGHVMRCFTLADLLADKGHRVYFICRDLPGNMSNMLVARGYPVFLLPGEDFNGVQDAAQTAALLAEQKPDWLITDHYQIDEKWEALQRRYVGSIMAIDDLADRKHDCDLLLDQNLYQNQGARYEGLVPSNCRKLLGPRFVLLRKEFDEARRRLKPRTGNISRILLFFGGSDPDNVTAKALKAFELFDYDDICLDVVVGEMNPNKQQIEEDCSRLKNARYYCQVDNMASLMLEADLAIGAGGTATWERSCLGLPCITLLIAENQVEVTEAVASNDATWNLGWHETVTSERIAEVIQFARNNPLIVKRVGEKALALMVGNEEGRQLLVTELAR
ncbi:MAG TPA: UDP-2,4-diacetamido-2,4,6-trideoxy-beta-L-altropyranose hydrolase [Selenomonadales bacterium]|nr:UDP-2,4-diacetamido-2,4,6-trideoxy-beta-L-altropyranose hydrolase [Selenomonadales bacterium]